ncbi:MAG: hypothetical protein CSA22_07480 [Deltaproteobacteria bacterium]|nr:MAG: hypothetical protein CSA22_07480 [Deltaproteobacteria bacterium]
MQHFFLRFRITVWLLFIPLFISPVLPPATAAEGPVIFKWAFRIETSEGMKTLDLSSRPHLNTGDVIQIFIEPVKNAHVYLYLLDPDMNLQLIYPSENVMSGAPHPAPDEYTIPEPPNRFQLTPPSGTEKFYLLASHSRMTDLESVTQNYLKDIDNDDAKSRVIQTIKQKIRNASRFSKSAEKGVPITGTLRTRGQDTLSNVTEVIAEDFYGKVIRMPHAD